MWISVYVNIILNRFLLNIKSVALYKLNNQSSPYKLSLNNRISHNLEIQLDYKLNDKKKT